MTAQITYSQARAISDPDFRADRSTPFDDLERPADLQPSGRTDDRPTFTEPCARCRGTGRWQGRVRSFTCRACNGSGTNTFRTSPHDRQRARANRARRNAADADQKWDAFKADHPSQAAWIEANRESFDFAAKMHSGVRQYGSLTPNMMTAIDRCIARTEERRQQRERLTQNVGNVYRIIEMFQAAQYSGIRRPRLRASGGLVLSMAGPNSRNVGCIYAKRDGEYIGKINPAGEFSPARAATSDDVDALMRIAADPLKEATAYGRLEGSCACCGRTLTDPNSVAAGIGPVCQSNWGL